MLRRALRSLTWLTLLSLLATDLTRAVPAQAAGPQRQRATTSVAALDSLAQGASDHAPASAAAAYDGLAVANGAGDARLPMSTSRSTSS